MGLWELVHPHARPQSIHLIGHITDTPQVVEQGNHASKLMVFHVVEVPGIEFHFKVLPTTPMRRKGDRVELTWTPQSPGTAIVEMMHSAPDAAAIRRRNAAYLDEIIKRDAEEIH